MLSFSQEQGIKFSWNEGPILVWRWWNDDTRDFPSRQVEDFHFLDTFAIFFFLWRITTPPGPSPTEILQNFYSKPPKELVPFFVLLTVENNWKRPPVCHFKEDSSTLMRSIATDSGKPQSKSTDDFSLSRALDSHHQ
jgi:hypothetical protein